MQPRAHRALVRLAARRASELSIAYVEELVRGCDDEDVHVVPLVGARLQSFGLTHTHRPGGSFGELFAPSAQTRCARLVARANTLGARDRRQAAYLFGRACHLLADVAVPARSRGVWHFYGDPLEAFIERHADDLARFGCEDVPESHAPEVLVESLARYSSTFPADTTRTTWGSLRMRWLGRGTRVDDEEAEAQAKAIVPRALSHTVALLRGLA